MPNSCRDKCPIKPSAQTNDNKEMKTLLEVANKDHETWKTTMAAHAKNVSELEIAIRNTKLRKLFYEFMKDLAHTTIITYKVTSGGFPANIVMLVFELILVHMAAHGTLNTLSQDIAAFIGFWSNAEGAGMETTSNKLTNDYAKVMLIDITATKSKAKVE